MLGKYLEVLDKGKTSNAMAKFMNLTPNTATLLTLDSEGNVVGEEEIYSRFIQKNHVIKTIPGAKVASNGFVIWGVTHFGMVKAGPCALGLATPTAVVITLLHSNTWELD
ncbi:copper-transporting ATPase HMA5 [Spatholobus suberectus]|nr:copper-transporting ATPase HMA5 [Spatholobus suberectus]